MKNIRFGVLFQMALFLVVSSLTAQENKAVKQVSNYNYHDAFAPFFYTKNGTTTRSAGGQPELSIGKIVPIIN